MPIQLNSPDWSIREAAVSRGSRSVAAATTSAFPTEFLTEESEVAEEFAAQPSTAIRGQSATPGALDFSCDLDAGETAILAIRHSSGALTFHLPTQSTSRGARQPNQVRFVVTVRSRDVATGKRGLGSKVIKAVLIKVGKAPADKAVSFLLPKLATSFERSAWSNARLKEGWLKVTRETLAKGALEAGTPTVADRSLLFVHGTLSNAASAYKGLAASDFFDRVKPFYGDRIFAFDHFTISRTPEENARMLLEGLPDHTTTFDVVTHSRGGLVLRNLVERAQVFGPLAQRFKLGRAVLVASPNQGTPLATPQRWGDTVGWVANLLELFPDNPFTTGAAFVANGLVWIARHASGDLPGLHSMDGAGNLIAELERPPGPPPDAYSALVANYNPTGDVLLRMLDTGIDQFFGSANDLVVPSEGGWRVAQLGGTFLPATRIGCYGPGGNLRVDSVTHVNFFTRPETVDFLVRALSGIQQPLKRIDPLAPLPDRRLVREGVTGLAPAASGGTQVQPAQTRVRAKAAPGSAAPRPSQPPLKITVVNGDLTFEKEPLLIGHYRSTRLTGTEAVMDNLIGGSMKHSLALGIYPLGPGTYQVFLNTQISPESPKRMPRPKAVIVAGLGEEGKLNAADLVHTVRQAVIAWSQRTTELEKKAPVFFDLSATLLGSGGIGVSAGQAAQRIAEAVYQANQLLGGGRGGDGKSWPRVRQLRLIELYLDRATEAWRALKIEAAAAPERYEIADEVRVGTGPLPRPLDFGYRGVDYDFITAESVQVGNGQTSINYTLDTKRARSEVRAQQTQGQLLRDLVSTAASAQNQDRQIGRTLFKLLVPVEMEAFFSGTGELQIELDSGTAGIPWELLDTDDNDSDAERTPWAIRTKLLRKLRATDFRQRVRDADVGASALVIGEPECPADYPRLAGARDEAFAVLKRLESPDALGERVKGLVSDDAAKPGPDARTVINTLLERPWRIVHISGHGELFANDGGLGGVVLSNGTFLGPAEIATMRTVPELVFVNCCHLAARNIDQLLGANTRQISDRVRFAAGVAERLIGIGVRCVIAAGWAVDDEGASTFATTFYTALLRGNRFIDAVAEARESTYKKEDNTWAAYQCYGDPNWVLRRDGAEVTFSTRVSADEFAGVASETALKLALETIAVQTKFQHFKPQAQLERVFSLEKQFGPKWGKNGSVAELFGVAHAAARDLEGAIRWYEQAVNAEDGTASLKAAEQLANIRVRLAWETVEAAQKERDQMALQQKEGGNGKRLADARSRKAARRSLAASDRKLQMSRSSARKAVKEALHLLEKLVAVHPTMERESMYGSACKRLALIEAATGRRMEEQKAIEAMKLHYQRAASIGRDTGASDVFYPTLNYLAAEAALNAGRRGWKGFDESVVEATCASLEAKSLGDPDFWSVVGQTELQLYKAVAAGKLASRRASLEKGYQDLYRRVSAPWMWSSVYDTARFVLRKYDARASAEESNAAESLLAYLLTSAQPK